MTDPVRPGLSPRLQVCLVAALGAVALGIVGVGAIVASSKHARAAEETSTPGVFRPDAAQLRGLTLITATRAALEDGLELTGKVAVDDDRTTPITSPLTGRVQRVLAEPGARVRQGQVLAILAANEAVDGRGQLATALADENTARARVQAAQETEHRVGEVYRTAGGAQKDWLQAQSDLRAAEGDARKTAAAVVTARDRLKVLELGAPAQGGAAQLRAPISGVLVKRALGVGQNLTAGSSDVLFVVSDTSRVWIVADLPEENAAAAQVGAHVAVTLPAAPGRELSAVVQRIGAQVDPSTRRLSLIASVSNPDGLLRPEMFASVHLKRLGSARAAIAIPAEAVVLDGDKARIWVLAADGALHSRPVVTGKAFEGRTEIVRGLEAGERVVTRGAIFIDQAGS